MIVRRQNNRFGQATQRHSWFGIAAVCLLAAAIIGGPFLWPLSSVSMQQDELGLTATKDRTYIPHPGPSLPGLSSLNGSAENSRLMAHTPSDTSQTGHTLQPLVPAPLSTFSHLHITTTWFWVGEPADADNAYISNVPSSWDSQWQAHYGGPDAPSNRSGYYPAGFTPRENPFYFALPYTDIADNSQRKSSASNCPLKNSSSKYSWCKNAWIAIRHGDRIAYAQWEDTGPYATDDTVYVFGTANPINTFDAKAGLDVSPAVRDYLNLQDVDAVDWVFVSQTSVPNGPWQNIITTSLGDNTIN